MTPLRILIAVALLQPIAPAPGISGRVLAPDGSPVTQGTVALVAADRVTADIDRHATFRIAPIGNAPQNLFISVPGYAPYHAIVALPESRQIALPDITLVEATYFHVRFTTMDGESLAAGGLSQRSIDSDGRQIPDPLRHSSARMEADGSLTIGPLPLGRTMFAFDHPVYARTRLRDVIVTGKDRLIEGGTIAIERGAQLQVEVVDAAGRAVPRHEVWLEDAATPSLLTFPMARTNETGHAVFERLASGRYRVFTQTPERCGNSRLTIAKLVTTGGSESSRTRLVIDGRVAVRVTSSVGPIFGRAVSMAPDAPADTPWQPRYAMPSSLRRPPPIRRSPPSCGKVTDNDGRIVLAPFPPGPALVRVQLFNSSYSVRVTVPESSAEIVIAVPDGLLPVHVVNRANNNPVSAQLTWAGGGGRVEASTTANGDALVEAVGAAGGMLTVTARGYQTLEGRFEETPETPQEVALVPVPEERVDVRVVDGDGGPIANAVVALAGRAAGDATEFVATDATGVARFAEVFPGALRFSAHAEGLAKASVSIAEEQRASIVIALARRNR